MDLVVVIFNIPYSPHIIPRILLVSGLWGVEIPWGLCGTLELGSYVHIFVRCMHRCGRDSPTSLHLPSSVITSSEVTNGHGKEQQPA